VTETARCRSRRTASLDQCSRVTRPTPTEAPRMAHAELRRRQQQVSVQEARRVLSADGEMRHQPVRAVLDLGLVLDIDCRITASRGPKNSATSSRHDTKGRSKRPLQAPRPRSMKALKPSGSPVLKVIQRGTSTPPNSQPVWCSGGCCARQCRSRCRRRRDETDRRRRCSRSSPGRRSRAGLPCSRRRM
jgi:hypothetical protein